MVSAWPAADKSQIDKNAEKIVSSLQEVVTEVRRFRNDQGLKPSQKIPGRFSGNKDVVAFELSLIHI